MLSTIQMEPIFEGTQNLVPFTVNGVPLKMLLDTGGSATQLSARTVAALNLEQYYAPIILTSASGTISRKFVKASTIAFGQLHGQDRRMMVSPPGTGGFDGSVSGDLLLGYDFDMDFGTHTLNFFDKEHCPGKVLYWKADGVAVTPATFEGESHIIIPVELDGQTINALVDTGATGTFMRVNIANRFFGLQKDSKDPHTPVNGALMEGYVHTFSTLSFGGESVTVKNPHVTVMWDRNEGAEQMSELHQDSSYGLVLGMNILKYLHLYVAANEKKIYISAATTPATKPEAVSGASH